MTYNTLIVNPIQHGVEVIINRLPQRNSLNAELLQELHHLIDTVEKDAQCRLVILKGQQGIFCTGMDFQERVQGMQTNAPHDSPKFSGGYMDLLKRFTLVPKVFISNIDGQVMAGGVGLVAASDIVIATSKSQFTLSEALWGLLPANVMPYLIRRVGFQKAYLMTLTTQTVSAKDAHTWHLVDELADNPDEVLHKLALRLYRLDAQTIFDLKQYFRKMWIMNEEMEKVAMLELERLIQEPRVQNNIKRFVEEGKFPWESAT